MSTYHDWEKQERAITKRHKSSEKIDIANTEKWNIRKRRKDISIKVHDLHYQMLQRYQGRGTWKKKRSS